MNILYLNIQSGGLISKVGKIEHIMKLHKTDLVALVEAELDSNAPTPVIEMFSSFKSAESP